MTLRRTPAASQAPLHPDTAWEGLWAPYDEPTYREVLDRIGPQDVVLEIGAGDLRLARRLARVARRVYAIEIKSQLVHRAGTEGQPANLHVITGDAAHIPFPDDISAAVLLMRHCTHFSLYLEKCAQAGCERFLTNARWRMGVEEILLAASPPAYQAVDLGWYACRCGNTGFVSGPPEALTAAILGQTHEVAGCPACIGRQSL